MQLNGADVSIRLEPEDLEILLSSGDRTITGTLEGETGDLTVRISMRESVRFQAVVPGDSE